MRPTRLLRLCDRRLQVWKRLPVNWPILDIRVVAKVVVAKLRTDDACNIQLPHGLAYLYPVGHVVSPQGKRLDPPVRLDLTAGVLSGWFSVA